MVEILTFNDEHYLATPYPSTFVPTKLLDRSDIFFVVRYKQKYFLALKLTDEDYLDARYSFREEVLSSEITPTIRDRKL